MALWLEQGLENQPARVHIKSNELPTYWLCDQDHDPHFLPINWGQQWHSLPESPSQALNGPSSPGQAGTPPPSPWAGQEHGEWEAQPSRTGPVHSLQVPPYHDRGRAGLKNQSECRTGVTPHHTTQGGPSTRGPWPGLRTALEEASQDSPESHLPLKAV